MPLMTQPFMRNQPPNRINSGPRAGGRNQYAAHGDGREGGRRSHHQAHSHSVKEAGRSGNSNSMGRGQTERKNISGNQNTEKDPIISPPMSLPFGCLPPFLPGSASLVEQLDQRILVVLRDGRHLVGVLRTFDQFANMVLEDTSERRILLLKCNDNKDKSTEEGSTVCYQTDIQLGLYIVRGDVVVLMGEIDEDEEIAQSSQQVRSVSLQEFEQLEEEEETRRKEESAQVPDDINWDFDSDLVA